MPASAPPEARDVGRFALVAIVATTGAIGAFVIWRAPTNRRGTRVAGSIPVEVPLAAEAS